MRYRAAGPRRLGRDRGGLGSDLGEILERSPLGAERDLLGLEAGERPRRLAVRLHAVRRLPAALELEGDPLQGGDRVDDLLGVSCGAIVPWRGYARHGRAEPVPTRASRRGRS